MLVIFLSFEVQHQRYMLFLIHMARSFRFGIMSVDDKSVWSNGCRWKSRRLKVRWSVARRRKGIRREIRTYIHTHTLVDTPRTRLPTRQVSILGTSKCKSARPAVQPLWLEFYLVKCCFYSNSSWVYFSITFFTSIVSSSSFTASLYNNRLKTSATYRSGIEPSSVLTHRDNLIHLP